MSDLMVTNLNHSIFNASNGIHTQLSTININNISNIVNDPKTLAFVYSSIEHIAFLDDLPHQQKIKLRHGATKSNNTKQTARETRKLHQKRCVHDVNRIVENARTTHRNARMGQPPEITQDQLFTQFTETKIADRDCHKGYGIHLMTTLRANTGAAFRQAERNQKSVSLCQQQNTQLQTRNVSAKKINKLIRSILASGLLVPKGVQSFKFLRRKKFSGEEIMKNIGNDIDHCKHNIAVAQKMKQTVLQHFHKELDTLIKHCLHQIVIAARLWNLYEPV